MRSSLQTRILSPFTWRWWILTGAFLVFNLADSSLICSQSAGSAPRPSTASKSRQAQTAKARPHHRSKKEEPAPVVQAPPPPNWPVNDQPNPASVVWDSKGLRINASNSSLQQILQEVSTETGTKVEGAISDQRVFGDYGPGQAQDVLAHLLQGSGYNFMLTGDLGQGAPREIVLSPRSGTLNASNNPNQPQREADEDNPDEPEDQPVQPPPPIQPPQTQNNYRNPGFGPNGPIRTPQQVMEEMQQRQQQQQQQQMQQQQQQQGNPPQ